MYAIIVTGSKQYKVKADDLFDIERIEGEEGKEVVFDKVLAVGEEGGKLNVGAPVVEGVTVKAQIVEQFRGKKIIAFKMKRRKGYRKTKGHRQELTRVRIVAINA